MSTRTQHSIILSFFLFVSLFLTLGRVGTAFDSFALLNPDLGVYASLAAAQDNPALFARDPFLSNERNINSYGMIQIPVLKVLNKIFGNYGTACAFLLPFIIFIHLTGYYLLGLSIFKTPWMGLLTSLLLSAPTATNYDFWGLFLDALPRFLYQSLIPYVLVLSIKYGRDLKWWPVILGSLGALNYIHPLSTPPWMLAIMVGLWVSAPKVQLGKRIGNMAIAVPVLLLILSPFITNYLKSTVLGISSVTNYERTLSILQSHISTMQSGRFLSPFVFFAIREIDCSYDVLWYLVWLFALGGLAFGWIYCRNFEDHVLLSQITAWLVGIFVVGGVVPAVERVVFTSLRRIPPEFEIARTLRYGVPLILVAALYSLRLITYYLHQKGVFSSAASRKLLSGVSIAFLFLWGTSSMLHRPDIRGVLRQNALCWTHGRLVCDLHPENMDFIELMNAVRDETPLGVRILSEGQEVAIRYYALRPLVLTYKDGAPLAYTDQKQLLLWHQEIEEMDKLALMRKFPFRHRGFVNGMTVLAQSLEADYLILREPYNPELYYSEDLTIVYTNRHYSLFKLNER